MKIRLKEIDKRWKEYALAGCVCILFFLLVSNISKVFDVIAGILYTLKPVIFGFILAYIFNPLAMFFSTKLFASLKQDKLRWTLSVVLTIVFVILIFALLIASLVPQLVDSVASLVEHSSEYIENLRKMIENVSHPAGEYINQVIENFVDDDGLISKLGSSFTDNMKLIISATTSIGGKAMNWGIGFIFAFYFLLSKESILNVFSRFFNLVLSSYSYESAKIIIEKFNSIFSKYISFELIDALIVGVANYLFMIVFRMPDALFISVLAGVTNLAPTFGPIIGAGAGAFVLLLIKPSAVIPFLIFTVVLQACDAYVIKPKLFGNALNVPGVLILIAIIVFGRLLGIVGMLIAIPVAAILVYVYEEIYIPWLQLRKDVKAYQKENQ